MNNQSNLANIVPYPTGKTICFFDEISDIDDFLESLSYEGIDTSDLDLISGPPGVNRIDIHGNNHHLVGKIVRAAQRFWGSGEWHMFKIADYELRVGHHMISILAELEPSREKIVEIMRQHNGHNITYFNRFYVQEL